MFGRNKLKAEMADAILRYRTALAECINIMDPEQMRKIGGALLETDVLDEPDKAFVTNLLKQYQAPTHDELRIMKASHFKGRIFNRKKKKK